jgi:hypothetical protein
MITKLETGAPDLGGQGASTGKGNNTLIYFVIGLGLLYLGYKFVYLPSKQKKEDEGIK